MNLSENVIHYNRGTGKWKNWIVSETAFRSRKLGKAEAVFSLGNGYMGLRSATEEPYAGEIRGLFVAGTFDRFPGTKEVTELPNAADMTEMEFQLDGETFNLTHGEIVEYERLLNLRQAELIRHIRWRSPAGKEYVLYFRRFVSLNNLHVFAQKVSITPLSGDAQVSFTSGINGQITNSGSQHFEEGELRLFNGNILKMQQRTIESGINFYHYSKHHFPSIKPSGTIFMDRRRIYQVFKPITVKQNQEWTVEKISGIFTSRDQDFISEGATLAYFKSAENYEQLFEKHVNTWEEKVWSTEDIKIDGNNFDQLAIRFALYHLNIMTPAHDNRMSIGAKGLSGEGYKGHAFWDTEVFVLPFFTVTHPKVARKLLEYRYLSLPGAVKKARENGYSGAMFPWESAWLDDGEVTPVYGAADIVTGKYTKIWSGFIEQHISADIPFAIWQYYQFTNDQDFMYKYGYEMIFATAIFWSSRLEWNESTSRYEINNVIGPDEYKEHANNNAFTNYMAQWNLHQALNYYDKLKRKSSPLLDYLERKWNLSEEAAKWKEKEDLLYLPTPNKEGVIPQDDKYLSKKIIDLKPYKESDQVGSLFLDYNLDQVNQMQATKQADVMILFFLLENKFSKDIKRANWNYYEPKTLHDSSLSRSIHSILANDIGDYDLAYKMFEKASRTDIGENMDSSTMGIHAASIGGIWQAVVMGFGGVRMLGGKLYLRPHLPEQWNSLSFPIIWKTSRLFVELSKKETRIHNQSDHPVTLIINHKETIVSPHSVFTF